ncbi:hypothetical protein EXS74_01850 [Candidatus Woesearchaeota archaeon]|nr:hypothetical protein [Candidatus Woesearchaeota archaeon]
MNQFPPKKPSSISGPYRYVSATKLPDLSTMTAFREDSPRLFGEKKGVIYVPKDSNLETYLINRTLIGLQNTDREKDKRKDPPVEIYGEAAGKEHLEREEETHLRQREPGEDDDGIIY